MSGNAERTGGVLSRTPREHRAILRAEAARLLIRLLSDLDIRQKAVAEWCGRSPTDVQRWADSHVPNTPSTVDLVMMPRDLALGYLRWIGDQHGIIWVDAPVVERIEDKAEHYTATVQELLDVASKLTAALTPGALTGAAERALDRGAADVMERLAALRARLGSLTPLRPVSRVK